MKFKYRFWKFVICQKDILILLDNDFAAINFFKKELIKSIYWAWQIRNGHWYFLQHLLYFQNTFWIDLTNDFSNCFDSFQELFVI